LKTLKIAARKARNEFFNGIGQLLPFVVAAEPSSKPTLTNPRPELAVDLTRCFLSTGNTRSIARQCQAASGCIRNSARHNTQPSINVDCIYQQTRQTSTRSLTIKLVV
jgi:hypothetical protein